MFLRCPTAAWPLVSTGAVSEFRAATGNAPQLWGTPLPSLAVAYRKRQTLEYDYRLIMLTAIRREALGAITDAGLAAAGYDGERAFAEFRRDWTLHERRRFEPLRTVFVYTVRLIRPGDVELAGAALVKHLYGEFIDNAQASPRTVTVLTPEARAQRRQTAEMNERILAAFPEPDR